MRLAHGLVNYGSLALENLLRLVSNAAFVGLVRVSGGSFVVSCCPVTHDNDKRDGSSGGGLWFWFAEWLGSGRIARAAREESFGLSPGSSSGVSCLWLLRVP